MRTESSLAVAVEIACREGRTTIADFLVPVLLERRAVYRKLASQLRQLTAGEAPYDTVQRVEGADKLLQTWTGFLEKEATWLECLCMKIAPKHSPQ